MGRIIVTEFVSLDGVYEDPHEWHFPFFQEQAQQYKMNELRATDALQNARRASASGRASRDGFCGTAWRPPASSSSFSSPSPP